MLNLECAKVVHLTRKEGMCVAMVLLKPTDQTIKKAAIAA
jgi:hypothetical protein